MLNQKVIRDINPDHWYYPFACTLASHEITLDDLGLFEPNKAVTRSDFAYLMYHALNTLK